jgi:hypothetical protein
MNFRGMRLAVFLLAIWLVPSAIAQSGSAELTGEVHDPSSATVAKATVTIHEQAAGQDFSTETSSAGIFFIAHLRPGLYDLSVSAPGFKRFVQSGILLKTGERVRLDVNLVVGASSESITVTGDAPLLRTESASLAQVIPNQAIVNLPLNGRTFVGLVGLSTGVALPPASQLPRLNGGRPRVNEYLYDGVSVLQPEPGQVAYFPIIDGIQEFNVTTNTPSAEYGYFSGGVINLTTKSGSDQFHGSLFEFLRNEVLNARNLFTPVTAAKPVFRRNQFGGTFGGPIVHNKTFFFLDYQGTRQLLGRIRTSTVPSLLQRQGIFTEPIGGKPAPIIYDPATTVALPGGGFTRQPFPNNTIPSSGPGTRIDPVAQKLLDEYPLPTASGTANNYTQIASEPDNQDQFDIRIDHRFSTSNQFFARYSYFKDFDSPVPFLPKGSGALSTTNSTVLAPQDALGQSFVASFVHLFRPTLTNEVRFGYTRRAVTRLALLLDQPPSQTLGLPGIPSNAAFNSELPTFLISGYQQLGPPPNTDSLFRTDVTEWIDTVGWQRGRHSLKFGADIRFFRLDVVQPPSPTGQFTFSNLFTNNFNAPNTGFSLASFLLGQVQNFQIDLQQKGVRPRAWANEYFIQDDYKITSKLTLNAGLRYTLNYPSTEVDNQGSIFNIQTQELQYPGRDGFRNTGRRLHWLDFGPRVGLAWLLTPKTVVRSGYGLIWFDQAGITTPFTLPQFPFLQTVSQNTLNNVSPAFVLANGPSVQPIPLTPDAGLGQGVFSVDRSQTSGFQQHWNLAIQRELTRDLYFEVAYAGSKGTHIGVPDTNANQLPVADLAQGTALLVKVPNPYFGQIPASSSIGGPTITRAQLMKPFPRFTVVTLFRNNVGNTDYNAFQAKLEKRVSHGFWVMVSYTRSKLIDDASSVFDASILTGPIANFPVADSYNRRLEQDVSNGDIPNAFAASWTYELPFGKGHALHPSSVVGAIVSGWQVSGIVTIQSGLPLAVTQGTNNLSYAGFGTQRPNCSGNTALPGDQRTLSKWFNTSAITVNGSQFALGTCSRNPIRGPSYRDADLALLRTIPIHESMRLDFRAEAFNLTNAPPLGAPNTLAGTAAFGTITAAGDPRVLQFALKFSF